MKFQELGFHMVKKYMTSPIISGNRKRHQKLKLVPKNMRNRAICNFANRVNPTPRNEPAPTATNAAKRRVWKEGEINGKNRIYNNANKCINKGLLQPTSGHPFPSAPVDNQNQAFLKAERLQTAYEDGERAGEESAINKVAEGSRFIPRPISVPAPVRVRQTIRVPHALPPPRHADRGAHHPHPPIRGRRRQ